MVPRQESQLEVWLLEEVCFSCDVACVPAGKGKMNAVNV